MAKKVLKIDSTSGIDALLAQKVVNLASEFEADMTLRYQNKEVDLKSILGIMSLAVIKDSNVEIIADGADAEKALQEIGKLLGKKATNA